MWANELADHQRVVVVEPAGHALAQLVSLDPQASCGHSREHVRVAFTGHNASRIARPVTPSVSDTTEDSFTLASSNTFCSRCTSRARSSVELPAIAGHLAQLPDLGRRHEAAPQQPAFQQLGDPRRVVHVGLAARARS